MRTQFLRLALAIGLLCANGFAQSGWVPVPTGSSNYIYGLFCINDSTVYVCGWHGMVAKTTNRGGTWAITVIDSSYTLDDIWFTNEKTGYVCGWDMLTHRGVLYRTTDGGLNWGLRHQEPDRGLNFPTAYITLCFTDSSNAYLGMSIGTNGNIMKTTDAGQTWIPYSGTAYIRAIFFTTSTHGLATGQGGVVYRTTDAGNSWTAQKFQLPSAPLYDFYSLAQTDSVTVFAAGDNGYLYKSTDDGTNWSSIFDNSQFTRRFTSLWFTNATTAFVAGDSGTIMKTTNAGATWQPQLSGTEELLTRARFVGQNVGYVAGAHGIVLTTRSGGEIDAVDPMMLEVPSSNYLGQNYPNPFNPSTVIRYTIGGVRGQGPGARRVKVAVYDLLGREVVTLVDEEKAPGSYEVRFDGSGLASGVYFYRLQVHPLGSAKGTDSPGGGRDSRSGVGLYSDTRKLVLVR